MLDTNSLIQLNVTIISEDNQKVKAYNEVIRHNYHSLKEATTINNYKIKDLYLKTDSARANAYGHQIVINKTIVNNNPKTIYYNRYYSSLIMFTGYLILKYIRENKPHKYIHSIETLRKPIEPETVL